MMDGSLQLSGRDEQEQAIVIPRQSMIYSYYMSTIVDNYDIVQVNMACIMTKETKIITWTRHS